MGFVLTLLISIFVSVLAIVRPRAAAYLIVALFVCFDELGPGFTTYRGSFVFNAYFVGFFGLRLVEVVTVFAYIPLLIATRDRVPLTDHPMKSEATLGILFFSLLCILMLIEVATQGKVTYSAWRFILTGCMQLHMLTRVFRTEEDVQQLVLALLALMTFRCVIGLAMYGAGFGTMSPRGRVPFFWDTWQVQFFGVGAVMLVAYMINYATVDKQHRWIPLPIAVFMCSMLLLAVVLSIRRTIWVETFIGMTAVLVLSKRTTAVHYFVVVFIAAMMSIVIALAPGLDHYRDQIGKYVSSMNFFNTAEAGDIENDVHVDNVVQYFRMITENPDIIALGLYGPSGQVVGSELASAYSDKYRLGMAHNGPLRTTLFFGFAGLIIYFAFYFISIRRFVTLVIRGSDSHGLKHMAVACGVFITLQFLSTLVFVPPFYTLSKGLFFTFVLAFIIAMSKYYIVGGKKVDHHLPGVSSGAWRKSLNMTRAK